MVAVYRFFTIFGVVTTHLLQVRLIEKKAASVGSSLLFHYLWCWFGEVIVRDIAYI